MAQSCSALRARMVPRTTMTVSLRVEVGVRGSRSACLMCWMSTGKIICAGMVSLRPKALCNSRVSARVIVGVIPERTCSCKMATTCIRIIEAERQSEARWVQYACMSFSGVGTRGPLTLCLAQNVLKAAQARAYMRRVEVAKACGAYSCSNCFCKSTRCG
eukprot:2826434-Rhodomonas_salina.1